MQSVKEMFLPISKWMWVFLAANLVLGIYAAKEIKAFGIPDESAHYFRALEVSRGVFINTKENSGVLIPCEEYKLAGTANGPIYNYIDVDEMVRLDPEKPCMVRTLNTAGAYSPLLYIFSAAGIKFSEMLGGDYKEKHYAGRIFNVIGNSIIIFLALCLIKNHRHVMAVISLVPIAFWLRSSLSADAITISTSMFFMCLVLSLAEKKHCVNAKTIIWLSIAALCVGATKPLVSFLPFSAIILWNSRSLGNAWLRFILLLLPGIISVLTAYCFVRAVNPALVMVTAGAVPSDQMAFVLQNPWYFVNVLTRTISRGGGDWAIQIMNPMNIVPYLSALALLVVTSRSTLGWVQRLVLLCVAIGLGVGAMLALYLNFTSVGYPFIAGLQGRLFLMALMVGLIALAFENNKLIYIGLQVRNFMAYILPLLLIARSLVFYMYALGM